MKFSLKVFKKGKPIYWILGALVIFVLFYLMFNKGSSSGGSTQVVSSGPSEALQAAQLQAQTATSIAQAEANLKAQDIAAQIAGANLAAQVQLASIQAGADVTKLGYEYERDMLYRQADTSKEIAFMQMQYGYDTARVAAESALAAKNIDAGLLIHQMDTNAEMFAIQSSNLVQQALIGQIGNLEKDDRDETLQYFIAVEQGQSWSPEYLLKRD